MMELLTNEWLDAQRVKPWAGREVLCLMSDGSMQVCSWNGFYWRDQEGYRVVETVVWYVTHFYIYEKFNENDIL